MTQLTERQPHFVVQLPGQVHVICIVDVRRLAAGEEYLGDKDDMIRLLAQIVKDLHDDNNCIRP